MKVDRITIRDLELFGIYEEGELNREKGIVNFFNLAITKEGKLFIEKYFSKTCSSVNEIKKEQKILKYFINNLSYWNEFIKDMSYYEFEPIIKYLNSNIVDFTTKKISFFYKAYTLRLLYENIFDELITGIKNVSNLLKKAKELIKYCNTRVEDEIIQKIKEIEVILNKKEINTLIDIEDNFFSSTKRILKTDHNIRFVYKDDLIKIIKIIAEFEGRIALAKAINEFNLSIPEFEEDLKLEIRGIFHPLTKNPTKNEINFNKNSNFLFLTGPNMAGKTTFLKAIGICVYLAHCGFGVPAESMKLCFFDRLLTIINIEENLTLSQSYFMSEVKRVKEIAKSIISNKRCLVLMDELFKGTNFQDAFETTLLVIKKMLNISSSIFVFSTHISELYEEIKGYKNIMFKFFGFKMEHNKIKYNYSLSDGISNDKLGVKILENEGILEILK